MKKLDQKKIMQSMIDLSNDVAYRDNELHASEQLINRCVNILTNMNGYLVFYGINKILKHAGLELKPSVNLVYAFYEKLFKQIMSKIDFSKYSVTPHASEFAVVDVDGYNVNQNFSHDGKLVSRKFITSKCLHYDTATPFVANIYGPNQNIQYGYPVIGDVQAFCRDNNVSPKSMATNIPDNYNVVIKKEYYNDIMQNYSFYVDLDFNSDIVMVMLLNEVEFGVAHGATTPEPVDPTKPSFRPLRHFEYQYHQDHHYDDWLNYYVIPASIGRDYDGTVNLSLDYYDESFDFTQNGIHINNKIN